MGILSIIGSTAFNGAFVCNSRFRWILRLKIGNVRLFFYFCMIIIKMWKL